MQNFPNDRKIQHLSCRNSYLDRASLNSVCFLPISQMIRGSSFSHVNFSSTKYPEPKLTIPNSSFAFLLLYIPNIVYGRLGCVCGGLVSVFESYFHVLCR